MPTAQDAMSAPQAAIPHPNDATAGLGSSSPQPCRGCAQCLGLPWFPPSCPALSWGGGMGPGFQALLYHPTMGTLCCYWPHSTLTFFISLWAYSAQKP